MLLDLPAELRNESLALGRYYPIIAETDEEVDELSRYLSTPRARLEAPSLLDRRPSQLVSDDVMIALYEPETEDWPYVQLCRWPDTLRAASPAAAAEMARGCYTMELYLDRASAAAAAAELIGQLSRNGAPDVRLLAGESLDQVGRA